MVNVSSILTMSTNLKIIKMNRKFIHKVLLQVTDITIKLFIASLATIAFGGIISFIFFWITGDIVINESTSFGILG